MNEHFAVELVSSIIAKFAAAKNKPYASNRTKAPDFKLINTNKEEVTLANFKGKNLVVFFFPMAWTGVCTKEMCSIQEDYNAIPA